jgi:hypothetical protein
MCGPHGAGRQYGTASFGSSELLPVATVVAQSSRAVRSHHAKGAPDARPLTVAGCGRRASVRQADAEQGDDLGAFVFVERLRRVAEHEQIHARVEVP